MNDANDTHYARNKQKLLATMAEYRLQNKEILKQKRRDYYLKNKQKMNAYSKNYSKQNAEYLKTYHKEYRTNNAAKIRTYHKIYGPTWRSNNADRRCQLDRLYRETNRDNIRQKEQHRYHTNPSYKISRVLRSRVRTAIKNQCGTKAHKTMDLIGCSISEARQHIEQQFTNGMSWQNHGQWHIDHKRPCDSFDLLDADQQRICFHYTNLQPLWAHDNIVKGHKYQ